MRKFPHLLPDDVVVWERFLDRHGSEYTHFEYDVRVGLGRDPGVTYPENMRQMALDLSLRRIDAVGHKPESLTVIEVTRSAGIVAIGQMICYRTLYRLTYFPSVRIQRLLVAESLQSDIEPVLTGDRIPYILV